MRVHLVNPSDLVFWHRGHHAAVAVRAGGGDAGQLRHAGHRRRDARAVRSRDRRSRATSSASASTPATPCAATSVGHLARERGAFVVFGGHPRHAVSRRMPRARRGPCRRPRRRRPRLGVGARRLRGRRTAPPVRRRPGRRRLVPAGALGSAADRQVHVGLGADRARLSEALLVLLGVAHRRPEAAPARRRGRRRGGRGAAQARLPLHRARRRQLLSGHPGRSRRWPRARAIPASSSR